MTTAHERPGSSVRELSERAWRLQKKGDLRQALEVYEQIESRFPDRIEAKYARKQIAKIKKPIEDEGESAGKRQSAKLDRTQINLTRETPQFKVFPNMPAFPWPYTDLVFGAMIILLPLALSYAVDRVSLISYRPWIAQPVHLFIWVAGDIVIFWYAIHACKKRRYWPLVPTTAFFGLLKEFFKSFLLVILINFLVSLSLLLLATILKIEPHVPKQWEFATYGPNSLVILLVLVFAFTLGPIIEEVFFRGFLYGALKTRFSVQVAITMQALIFALYHRYDLLNAVGVFLLGVALALVYETRKTLYSPIFVHSIKNALFAVPLIILTLVNLHDPAANWVEAAHEPDWLAPLSLEAIERQKDGTQQWQYAIDTWGSKGSRQWKKEFRAFEAVLEFFPEDRLACSKAQLGKIHIYNYYLQDYRRAVIESDRLLSEYSGQKEQCAKGVLAKGWAYYMLRDFQESRNTFDQILNSYSEFEDMVRSARYAIKIMDDLQKVTD